MLWPRRGAAAQRMGDAVANKLAGAIADMWRDVDSCFADLSDADATTQHNGGSSFAWTLLHIIGWADGNYNVRTRGKERHPFLLDQFNRFRETPGVADDWPGIQRAVAELRADVQGWLEGMSEDELAAAIAPATRTQPETPLTTILWRDLAHTHYHLGEVATKRDQMGQRRNDYPTAWEHAI